LIHFKAARLTSKLHVQDLSGRRIEGDDLHYFMAPAGGVWSAVGVTG
jgi:uncharacterized membrane protein